MTTRGETTAGRLRRWYAPHSIWRSIRLRPRIIAAVGVALVAQAVLPHSLPGAVRGAVVWNLGGLTYLALALRVMWSCGADIIRRRAARQDDSGIVILSIVLLAIAASFAAITELITTAKSAGAGERLPLLALAATTILVSWLVTQVVFTLHYAHEHYAPPRSDEPVGGLLFPQDDHPDYWDFFYFSTSIGATSQTSDVSIRSKVIRRLVTLHAIVSFFFNTMVLALTINLAASLVG